MEEAIAIVKKYRDNVLGGDMCSQIERAVLNSIIEDLEAAQQSAQSDGLKPCAECGALGYSHRPECSKFGSYVVSTRR